MPAPETLLIVDDTPANLGVLVETLSAAGYALMVAEDGEEALAQTAQTQPDLILLDVMMPGLDGFETCRRLKARDSTRDIPVLFMTALNETADKVKAFAAGGVDYITKPIEHEEALARIRTHLALRRLQRELAGQLALKEKFMRIAGHDLRNPVCLILFAAELARRQPALPSGAAGHLASITESADQIRRIIDTFLDLRGVTPDAAAPGRCDLALLAAAVVRQHEPAAQRKRLRLSAEPPATPLPPARADAALAYQALANLVSNALKFTPPGGAVTVGVTLTPALSPVTSAPRAAAPRLRITVVDTGPGVPAGERAQLFTAGAKLSPRPTAGEESHGHGLAIVKHLVESQAGAVGVDFPPAGGSAFWCEFPT